MRSQHSRQCSCCAMYKKRSTDHYIRIGVRVKRNFDRIWIAIENPLVKPGPGQVFSTMRYNILCTNPFYSQRPISSKDTGENHPQFGPRFLGNRINFIHEHVWIMRTIAWQQELDYYMEYSSSKYFYFDGLDDMSKFVITLIHHSSSH